jgi:formylglycine-generating enzyme required for sulfatase activity
VEKEDLKQMLMETLLMYTQTENQELIPVKYRLPTEAEWEYAALGMSELKNTMSTEVVKNTHGMDNIQDLENV